MLVQPHVATGKGPNSWFKVYATRVYLYKKKEKEKIETDIPVTIYSLSAYDLQRICK